MISRRWALWAGMSAMAASLFPAWVGAQAKIAQKLVQYQEKPKGQQECDNCLQFVTARQLQDGGG